MGLHGFGGLEPQKSGKFPLFLPPSVPGSLAVTPPPVGKVGIQIGGSEVVLSSGNMAVSNPKTSTFLTGWLATKVKTFTP
jgi:hypothetical protein